MNPDLERQRLFTRRAAVLGGFKVVLLSTLFGRLYYLQVMESDRYTMLAEENRINVRLLAPPRGLIVDRNGVPLVRNRQDYRAMVVAERVPDRDLEQTLDALATIMPIGKEDRRRILREVERNHGFVPVTARDHLTWEDVAKIEINAPALPGVTIETGMSRDYLLGAAGSHIIGYIGAVDESELTNEPLLRLPDFRIGKNGVERVYDLALRGEAGTSQVEINAHGRVIRELSRREPKLGRPLKLTIDADIQRYAYERLGEESGAVVVLDVHTGEVLALASAPGFDPNAFDAGITAKQWRALITSPRAPLSNKAVSGQYAPGSTFKTVVTLAGLESGAITPNHTVTCLGVVQLGDARFHCWKKGGHGTLGAARRHQAILRRLFLRRRPAYRRRQDRGDGQAPRPRREDRHRPAGRAAGHRAVDRLEAEDHEPALVSGRDLGLRHRPGLHAGDAAPARGHDRAHRQWRPRRPAAPGQGRGTRRRDHAAAARQLPVARHPDRGARGGQARHVRRGQRAGRHRRDARASTDPKFAMAGKTGTSQVRRIGAAERATGVIKNENLEWAQRDHALFISYAPADAPRYACAVLVEHGGGGSAVAAPIAKDVLLEVQKRNPTMTDPAKLAEAEDAPIKRAGR